MSAVLLAATAGYDCFTLVCLLFFTVMGSLVSLAETRRAPQSDATVGIFVLQIFWFAFATMRIFAAHCRNTAVL
jgi:hypothetical protein